MESTSAGHLESLDDLKEGRKGPVTEVVKEKQGSDVF